MPKVRVTQRLHNRNSRHSDGVAVEEGDWESFVDEIQSRMERRGKQADSTMQKTGQTCGRDSKGCDRDNGKKSSEQRRENRQLVLRGKRAFVIADDISGR